MTPITLTVDRIFRGVGRIKKATGTTLPALQRKIDRMLTSLFDDGRLDILRAIRDGHLTLIEVYAAYQARDIDALPTAETVKPLAVSMKAWIDGLTTDGPSPDCSVKHKGSLETSRRYFERENPKATIADLPDILEALRVSLGAKHPRSFNLARAAGLAFVRATLKRSHPIYQAIAAVEVRPVKTKRRHAPLTVEQMRELFPARDTNTVDGIAWGMATTGMGQGEYWGQWSLKADRIHIEGTKRAGRVRDVPLILAPAVPSIHPRTFEDAVRERSRAITVYDLRRTYANWLEGAGIPRTRRKLYLGHGSGDVTDLYEKHEVAAYLADDGAKLRAFLGLGHTKTHTITLTKGKTA